MKNIYNIIGKKILIQSDFQYEHDRNFDDFEEKSKSYDIKVKFIEKEIPYKFNYPILYDKNYIRIYQGDKGLIREFTGLTRNRCYGCLFELSDSNSYYEYHYYTYAKQSLKNTYNIFERIAFEHILYKANTFILHSSYIKYKDKGILFSAPSGVGKSTQASLWEQYEKAEIINGDRTAINKNNGTWCAYGLPFAGSSRIYKNVTTPLEAIVILKQSKENSIKKLSTLEGFKYIYSETTINSWNRDFINTIINLIMDMLDSVDVYMLSCRPDRDAVDLLKNKLGDINKNER